MTSVLTFDDDTALSVLVLDEDPESLALHGTARTDVLVMDPLDDRVDVPAVLDPSIVEFDQVQTSVGIGDPSTDGVVVVPGGHEPDVVMVDNEIPDVVVITADGLPGKPGPAGPATPGPPGPQGLPGAGSYEAVYSFAQPSTLWVIEHNLGSYAVDVQTFDGNGEPLEANVRFPDENHLEIDWYFPTSGLARLFR